MNIDLTGKRALVCGGSQGIGKGAALSLAECGAHITVLARDPHKLEAVVKELNHLSPRNHQAIAVDLLDAVALEQAIKIALKHASFDILVLNTGGPPPGPISQASPDAFEKAFKMHILASQQLTQWVLPGMKAQQYGRIIGVTSGSVRTPYPELGVSNTMRWALTAWAKTLSYEVGPFGITVNMVMPGNIDTPRLHSLLEYKAELKQMTVEALRKTSEAQIPAQHIGSIQEIGDVIAFLATPAAAYINGASIPVDGGKSSVI
ncbi:MAG TPA: SDR family oxidoreductase [Coxiellaceae bacterium]|nr:SDR family oxidoreductase [Coxiellaceae bacterium]